MVVHVCSYEHALALEFLSLVQDSSEIYLWERNHKKLLSL